MKTYYRFAAVVCAIFVLAAGARAQEGTIEVTHTWDQQSLALLSSVPIQDGGRVKPLDTFARFTLLKLNGKRSYTTDAGDRVDSLTWLLNVLFFPEDADRFHHFCVDNSEVLVALGLKVDKPRARYSYEEISAGLDKLFELAQHFSLIEDRERDPLQRMTINLATNVRDYEALSHALDFARHQIRLEMTSPLIAYFPDGNVRASDCLLLGNQFAQLIQGRMPESTVLDAEAKDSFRRLHESLMRSRSLALTPPTDRLVSGWYTPSALTTLAIAKSQLPATEILSIEALQELTDATDDATAFRAAAMKLRDAVVPAAESRGEYARVQLEVTYYGLNLLFWSQWLFVLSFVVLAITWLLPRRSWLERIHSFLVVVPWLLLVAAIILRCIIRGRPPVSTLYESILFVTAVFVVVAMFLERVNRQRVAMALATLAGTAGLFLAYKHETTGGNDTMPSLVAVLDTNFWLSTHVTTVTTGYAAGLLAGFLGCVYIISQLFRVRSSDKSYSKSLSRMIYGTVCFGLVFSFVGTVLGGIWANYSWGRFWGWDPKENGALLIVLCNLGILHARLGGIIQELGLAMGAVFCGMVVAFSWWGVNLLGVGLHSYGFTSGVWNILFWFWMTQTVVLTVGVFLYTRSQYLARRQRKEVSAIVIPMGEPVTK